MLHCRKRLCHTPYSNLVVHFSSYALSGIGPQVALTKPNRRIESRAVQSFQELTLGIDFVSEYGHEFAQAMGGMSVAAAG